MRRPHFHKDLARGKAGELAVQKLWPELVPTDGRSGDFVLPDGSKVEAKSDQYDHDKTVNFFFEHYSDINKGKLGGPFQALQHGCSYFVYYFGSHNIAYVFDLVDLLKQIEEYIKFYNPRPIEVHNVRWTTLGYAMNRKFFKPLRILQGPK